MTKEELKVYMKAYREANKERIKKLTSEWHIKNKEAVKNYKKEYRETNKEKIRIEQKEYREANKDKIKAGQKKWRENNKEKKKLLDKQYSVKNKDKRILRERNRRQADPLYALSCAIRNKIGKTLRNKRLTKNSKTQSILGCSFEELKLRLESQFEPWMNWENRGLFNGEPNYGWDIDHIIPLSCATTEEDVIRLNHYTNLRPLCSYYNRIIKKNKLIL